MKRIITLDSELIGHSIILKCATVIAPLLIALSILNLFVHDILASAIIATLISLVPLFGLIWITNRLPKAVGEFVQEKLPEHIEYASTDQLRRELLTRQRGVLIQDDDVDELIRVWDTYTEGSDSKEIGRLFTVVGAWVEAAMHEARNRENQG
jgi:hypothetical protein